MHNLGVIYGSILMVLFLWFIKDLFVVDLELTKKLYVLIAILIILLNFFIFLYFISSQRIACEDRLIICFQFLAILCIAFNSGSWWWTGRPGVLRFMGSPRVGHDWATDLIWSDLYSIWPFKVYNRLSFPQTSFLLVFSIL